MNFSQKTELKILAAMAILFFAPSPSFAEPTIKDNAVFVNLKRASGKALGCPHSKSIRNFVNYMQLARVRVFSLKGQCTREEQKLENESCYLEFSLSDPKDGDDKNGVPGDSSWAIRYRIQNKDPATIREISCELLAG